MGSIIQENYNRIESEINAGLKCGYYSGYASAMIILRVRRLISPEDSLKILDELSELYKNSVRDAISKGIKVEGLPKDVPCDIKGAIDLELLLKSKWRVN